MSQTKAQLIDGKVATVEFSGGSASAPSIAFTGDTNTGIYSPGADQVAISTNGSGRISIDSSGNINVLQENAGPSYPEQRLKWSNDSTTTNGFYISQGTDRNGKIWHEQGLDIQFATNNTERMRLDSSGRLGIGTSAPAGPLQVSNASDAVVDITNTGTGLSRTRYQTSTRYFQVGINDGASSGFAGAGAYSAVLWNVSNTPLVFATDNTQRAQIDASGRLLVGTSTALGDSNSRFQVVHTGPADIYIGRSDGDGTSGNRLGSLVFQSFAGSSWQTAASIVAEQDAASGANDKPGRLTFSTTADGASSPTERMRISQDGKVLVGATSSGGNGGLLQVKQTTTATPAAYFEANASAGNQNFIDIANVANAAFRPLRFFVNGYGATEVGSIACTTTATAYNTSSDYRLKENVTPVTDGISRLQQLKPSRFNFISEPSTTVDGFIAHEVQPVVPEAITGKKDAVDADGKPVYQGIDQSKLVPLLTAALQEAVAKIESLEARLTAAGI